MMTYLQATCNTHSLRCTGCIYVDSKECRTASWRYHTGRFICENSIAQGDLDRGEYFLLSGRYSPLILYLRIGLKTSASIYQLLTFQLTLCQQTRVSIYFQKNGSSHQSVAVLHCTRSKDQFRVTLFPVFLEQKLSHFFYFLAYRGSASVSGPRLPPNLSMFQSKT